MSKPKLYRLEVRYRVDGQETPCGVLVHNPHTGEPLTRDVGLQVMASMLLQHPLRYSPWSLWRLVLLGPGGRR